MPTLRTVYAANAEPRRIRGGTPALLAELGFPPRRSVDRVSARVVSLYGDDERPVEVTVMVKAGHLYELRYEFTPE